MPDLHLLEESAWKAPNVDVWGISDLDLFRESIGVLDACEKPFVAVIQTAGFHRPYTIPKDNAGFVVKDASPELIKNYGYANAEEYNSLRFSDHALGEFFRLASTQPWFKDTIFAIVGEDFGLLGCMAVIALFVALMIAGYRVAIACRDKFGALLAAGITSSITVQAFLNMGVVVGILPTTGLPLPFFSAGGTSVSITMAAMGILMNISRTAGKMDC